MKTIEFTGNKDNYARQLGFKDFDELENLSEQLLNDGMSIWYVAEMPNGKAVAWCYDGNIPSEAIIFNNMEEAERYQLEGIEEQGFEII